MEHCAYDNGAVADTDTGDITKGSKCGCDGKVRDLIPPPFLPSLTLDDCEDKNDDDDEDIYYNYNVPNHNYHLEYRSLEGTGAGEVKSLAIYGGSGRQILDG